MSTPTAAPVRTRMAAADRRDLVLEAAVAEFGAHGWHGARIEAIAARAGISHPYLLRLFAGKRDIFQAAVERAFDRLEAAFTAAIAAAPASDPMLTLGDAHRRLLAEEPAVMRLHMHALAVAADDEVGHDVTVRVQQFLDVIRALTGADEDGVRTCFAVGLTYAAFIALDLPDAEGHLRWGASLLAPPTND